MRVLVVVSLLLLGGCASEKFSLKPPPGVDFTGRWRLNEADSDDPLRLYQSQVANSSRATAQGGQGGGQGRQGGRGGRQQGAQGGLAGLPQGPTTPELGALGEGLRWPGKEVEIKQVAGVVAISSAGVSQVYQPLATDKTARRHAAPDAGAHGRDAPGVDAPGVAASGRDRGRPPALCGWDDKTLVVQPDEADDDQPPFEERYSLSDDGQRLIEVVGFKGGRSGGFTMSRVWDRVPPGG